MKSLHLVIDDRLRLRQRPPGAHRRPPGATRPRSSTVYRNTSSSSPTSGSISRGTARSTMSTGRCRRALTARSRSVPLPMMGSGLAVQLTTMSCGREDVRRQIVQRDGAAGKRPASSCSALVRAVGESHVAADGARAKCAAQSSIISPAPMNSTLCFGDRGIDALRRAAPQRTPSTPRWRRSRFGVRTSFATEKVRWKSLLATAPACPPARPTRTACLNWPRICGSPSTIESSPLATRKACLTARSCGRR